MSTNELKQQAEIIHAADSVDFHSPKQRSHRSEVSLQVRYEHHKARHQHYKKAYRHVRKYRWISAALVVISFASVFYLVALLPTYHDLRHDYEGLLSDFNVVEQQNLKLNQALQLERKYNFELNKENHPELRVFAFDSLIAIDQQHVRSAFFVESENQGKQIGVSYQLLVEGPIEQALVMIFIDQGGEEVFRQGIDFNQRVVSQGQLVTLDGSMSYAKQLDIRYFRIEVQEMDATKNKDLSR
ncbi:MULTISPECIES: hypothetical protein [unclassified Agarivorans]|uniref:hypothetical protein n=1 Tax=unclassified Agarivorans TaxID=2636026 RepID=UPI003D7E812C